MPDMAFGSSISPHAILDQSGIFNIYHGIGIELAILGFAEIDRTGKVNVSKFNNILKGSGGFIDIVMCAKEVILCGFSTTKSGKSKFVEKVEHITVDFSHPVFKGKKVTVITEICTYKIEHGKLIELS